MQTAADPFETFAQKCAHTTRRLTAYGIALDCPTNPTWTQVHDLVQRALAEGYVIGMRDGAEAAAEAIRGPI